MALLKPGMHVHLVGIGGIGLSAIARVLHGWGYLVSGSDQQESAMTRALQEEGIRVSIGHRADYIAGAELLIVSSAIPESNVEIVAARRRGLTVAKREQLLAELTAGKTTIAVAGAHGKTTTSAMIAWIFSQAGLEPTFIVGGVLQNMGTNARSGRGPHFVIEADEYDRTFLGLHPDLAVITILEHDHPDCYPTFDDMRAAFGAFAAQVRPQGALIVCGDDAQALQVAERQAARGRRVVTYGVGEQWDWHARGVQLGNSAALEVWRGQRLAGTCALQMPGLHNVLNALAALAVSAEAGIEFSVAAAALTRFRGTARRFEIKGHKAGITVVDDYAHHPTEIRATLAAARLKYPGRNIWAVFQPHTYSRTAVLLDDFATAFGDAEHVLVTPIYAARETNSLGISGRDLVARTHHPDVRYVGSMTEVVEILLRQVKPGDVVLTLGAGDSYLIGEQLLQRLENGGSENERAKERTQAADR